MTYQFPDYPPGASGSGAPGEGAGKRKVWPWVVGGVGVVVALVVVGGVIGFVAGSSGGAPTAQGVATTSDIPRSSAAAKASRAVAPRQSTTVPRSSVTVAPTTTEAVEEDRTVESDRALETDQALEADRALAGERGAEPTAALESPSSAAPVTVEPEPPEPVTPSRAPSLTRSERNAVQTANDYLSFSAFSRQGLIEQLVFEGYSSDDATSAVDRVSPDWNEQAAQSAEDYLSFSAFSRQGLIEQLMFDGFTREQATYGVNQTGL